MNPLQAGAIMKAGRLALRRGVLTSRDICLLDCLLFSCRAPGARQTEVSLRRLAQLAGMCRDTVIAGLRRLEAVGLIEKYRQRVRVFWASRQARNRYVFVVPATGSTPPTALREQVLTSIDPRSDLALALASLGAAVRSGAGSG